MKQLYTVIIVVCSWIYADTSIWSFGTAHSLPKGQWEVGLFQPLRYGMTDDQDIALHPLFAIKLPNLVYKKTWVEKNSWTIATRHGFYYPTPLLQSITGAGKFKIVAPQFEFPTLIGLTNEILATHSLGDGLLTGKAGLLLGLGGGDLDPLLFGQEPHQKIGNVDRLRDEMELQLTRAALNRELPIFAICRGIQVLSIAAGGAVYQDIASEMPQPTLRHSQKGAGWYASHTIDILPDSHLHKIIGGTTTRVNSFHHQAVREAGEGFTVTAKSKDGVIEAIENPKHRFALGVQYHPEMMWERHAEALNLFTAFLKACR